MATYVIGDVQGCFDELCELLSKINWQAATDHLWFVGDMVNRGPKSLEVLRFIYGLGEKATCVLGNHDLHLLARNAGVRAPNNKDTFDDVLQAEDREALVQWLSSLSLFHYDAKRNIAMAHAGLYPWWTVEQALAYSGEVAGALQDDRQHGFFENMYGNEPAQWSRSLKTWPRLRFITNTFTRMRYFSRTFAMTMQAAGPPEEEKDVIPWFTIRERPAKTTTLVFGHWASLRLSQSAQCRYNVHHVDHGCVWGDRLSALRLEDFEYFSVPGWRNREPK